MLTEEQLDAAVKSCKWRGDFAGVGICRALCGLCIRVIESGHCPTFKELSAKEKEGGEKSDA